MILSSYFIPHSPVLIARIGGEHTKKLKQTLRALEKIKKYLEADKPETIVVLSAHSPATTNTLTINLAEEYKLDLSEFGDLTTRQTWRPDVKMINYIAYQGRKRYDVNLLTNPTLDYGTSIPLYLLTEKLPSVKIVPITYAELPLPEMIRFGAYLESEISTHNTKTVILATGDLSHTSKESNAKNNSKILLAFDHSVKAAIEQGNFERLLTLEQNVLHEIGQCGLRALLVLAGAMQNKKVTTEVLSYENALGVGYLSARFKLI